MDGGCCNHLGSSLAKLEPNPELAAAIAASGTIYDADLAESYLKSPTAGFMGEAWNGAEEVTSGESTEAKVPPSRPEPRRRAATRRPSLYGNLFGPPQAVEAEAAEVLQQISETPEATPPADPAARRASVVAPLLAGACTPMLFACLSF